MTLARGVGFAVAAVVALVSLPVRADEIPLRKPGLWEMKMGAQGPMLEMSMQHCTDETTDKDMSTAVSPMAKDTCSKNEITKTANGYTTDAVCTIAGTTSTTHSDITGDFNSAYTVKVTSQASGGAAGAARTNTMTIEAKWLGACKPGQKPGDVMMPGGMKININDLNAARGRLPK
jgi:hypothetical protein